MSAYQYTPDDFGDLGRQMLEMTNRPEGFTKGEQVLTRALEAFAQQIDRLTTERDQARRIAVALEAELAICNADRESAAQDIADLLYAIDHPEERQ